MRSIFSIKYVVFLLLILLLLGGGLLLFLNKNLQQAILSNRLAAEPCSNETSESTDCINYPIKELDSSESTISNVNVASTEPPTPTPTPTPTPRPQKPADARGQVFFGRGTANNKIGMYVHNSSDDIKAAKSLINSNGGDWGYVLLTMNISDSDKKAWQKLFDAAKESHLIPIVQLFNGSVCNPDKMDFEKLADTLGDLKWPSKYRYISVFNEMNAKDYWCERIAPDEYAKALNRAIKEFKNKSSNFFIMPGAFNSSARTQDRYMSEESYLASMNAAVPGIFKKIDGWATHAYPQPNFSGDPYNLPSGYSTRDTINNYTWELNLLKNNFGVGNLPVFITETGWLHKEGQNGCFQYSQAGLLNAETVAARYKIAFADFWLNDDRVVAITPFIFRSSDKCAAGFAWQKSDGSWYPQAKMLIDIPKTAGTP